MGVIQTGDSSGCLSLATARHPPLALKDFTAKTTLSDGHTIIKLDNGDLGLFFSKAITTRSDKELTSKWLQHSFQHSSNVLNFSSSAGLTIMCGAHLHCRAIVEYGDVTLAEIIKEKDSNREKGTSFDQSLLALS